MTKKELQKLLKKYGIDVSLRPRKSTLERLYEEVRDSVKVEKKKDYSIYYILLVLAICGIALLPWTG